MNDKELKKYIQTGFKHFKEINKHLRYYFNAYYVYKYGLIIGTTEDDSIERIITVNPDLVEQYRYSGITSEKLYEEIKDAKQSRITVLNGEDKIKIINLPTEETADWATIDKLYRPSFGDEEEFVNSEITPKFYKKFNMFMAEMPKFENQYRSLEPRIMEMLIQKRPVTITQDGVTFRFSKTLFPELNKDSIIKLMVLDYREEGKRFIIFKDQPNDIIIAYSLIAVLDLNK